MADRNQSNAGYGGQQDWQHRQDDDWRSGHEGRESQHRSHRSSGETNQPPQSSYAAQGSGWYGGTEGWGSRQGQGRDDFGSQSGSYSGATNDRSQQGFGSQGYGTAGGSYDTGRTQEDVRYHSGFGGQIVPVMDRQAATARRPRVAGPDLERLTSIRTAATDRRVALAAARKPHGTGQSGEADSLGAADSAARAISAGPVDTVRRAATVRKAAALTVMGRTATAAMHHRARAQAVMKAAA